MKISLQKFLMAIVFLLGTMLFGQIPVWAGSNTMENVYLDQAENVSGDFIRAGSSVKVDGEVSGDNIAAGNVMTFAGRTGGDVLSVGNTVRVKAPTGGNVRVLGGTVILESSVEKNVTIFGASVIMEEGADIKGNLYVFGGDIQINGRVDGNAYVYGGNLVFAGEVKGDAVFETDQIDLREAGKIDGKLSYKTKPGQDLANAHIAAGGAVRTGDILDSTPKREGYNWAGAIWKFLSLLLLAFILFKLFRRQMSQMFGPIQSAEIWGKVATGFLSLIVNPIVIVVSLITLIGVPFGIFLTIVYMILILLAKEVVAPILVGKLLNGKVKVYATEEKNWWMDFVVGFVVLELISLVPFLGWIILSLVFLFSFGRVTVYGWSVIRRNQKA